MECSLVWLSQALLGVKVKKKQGGKCWGWFQGPQWPDLSRKPSI